MIRPKSVVAAIAAACMAIPLSAFATPAFASPLHSAKQANKVVVFAERDEDENENEHESEHHEGHHQIPPVIIRPHQGDDEGDDDDYEDHDGSGSSDDESDDDGEGGFVLPGPIDPSNPNQGPSPSTDPLTSNGPTNTSVSTANYSISPVAGAAGQPNALGAQPPATTRNLNPEAAPPVQIQQVRGPQRTPADVFMESATFGLIAVGAGAIALGGVAGARAIKLRRNPKGDYFYGD